MSDELETLLLIIGAGASHDCLALPNAEVDRTEVRVPSLGGSVMGSVLRPPLTPNLGRHGWLQDELLTLYPDARPLVSYLRHRLNRSNDAPTLEQALADYDKEAARDPSCFRHMMAFRIYLQHMLWVCTEAMCSAELGGGATNYTQLVSQLRRWIGLDPDRRRVLAISFNYDRLLEQACHDHFRLRFQADELVRDPYFKVVKPHGSMNWGWKPPTVYLDRPLPRELRTQDLLDRDDLCLAPLPDLAPIEPAADPADGGYPMVPVLALPIENGAKLLWPPSHEQQINEHAGTVNRVLTIGWRGAEPHFLHLLPPLLSGTRTITTLCVGKDSEGAAETRMALMSVSKRFDTGYNGEGGFRWLMRDPAGQHDMDSLLL